MIGDFDGSANALWGLYRIEAQSYDEARIQSLKDDMDGVLIFVRSHSVHNQTNLVALITICISIGWFIFCSPHIVCHR
jgi:hypothetical protein